MLAGVGELHGVAELDPGPALGPVVTPSCHWSFYSFGYTFTDF